MLHLDARAARERLHAIAVALSTLQDCASSPGHRRIALEAHNALREIATLITADEMDEHGSAPPRDVQHRRHAIRAGSARDPTPEHESELALRRVS